MSRTPFHSQSWLTLETMVGFFLLFGLTPVQPADPLRYNKELSRDVTTLLDQLLSEDKYDKRFRPNFGGL